MVAVSAIRPLRDFQGSDSATVTAVGVGFPAGSWRDCECRQDANRQFAIARNSGGPSCGARAPTGRKLDKDRPRTAHTYCRLANLVIQVMGATIGIDLDGAGKDDVRSGDVNFQYRADRCAHGLAPDVRKPGDEPASADPGTIAGQSTGQIRPDSDILFMNPGIQDSHLNCAPPGCLKSREGWYQLVGISKFGTHASERTRRRAATRSTGQARQVGSRSSKATVFENGERLAYELRYCRI